jgi:hypothetical protein
MSGWLDWMSGNPFLAGTVMAIVCAAGVSAFLIVHKAPLQVEPPNPMAKYRQEADASDEES